MSDHPDEREELRAIQKDIDRILLRVDGAEAVDLLAEIVGRIDALLDIEDWDTDED